MLIFILVASIAVLLLLIIKFNIHAFVALTIVSLLTAIATGIPVDKYYQPSSVVLEIPSLQLPY
ncbi:H+/gluconate symporter-related permease [Rodentibacter pneumotropicus]|uniref:H+/gluconate symporter-related permease n=1 Tax=Rodentibacter pneumotropicus TaxID=758 RepID=A0A448MRU7_9PAST|nr:H+/gluconate symporter-related permease [Rodentibacter pneumotropicus]